MAKSVITTKQLKSRLQNHDDFWAKQRTKLREYKDASETNFYRESQSSLNINTPYAHKLVEQHISLLFLRQPGILVSPDSMTINNTKKVEALINQWIAKRRRPFENTTRLAIIYPQSYVKVYKKPKAEKIVDLLDVQLECINPWDVLLDRDANSWETMRFAAHQYYLPVSEVKKRFGDHKYQPKTQLTFWDPVQPESTDQEDELDDFKSIKIIEFYDLENDLVSFFTPDTKSGMMELETNQIPIRTEYDEPLLPIVPLYFDWAADQPLIGVSPFSHFYDLIREINISRSKRAEIVDKNAVVFAVDADATSDQDITNFQQLQDGEIWKLSTKGRNVNDIFQRLIPQELGAEFNRAIEEIQGDYERATNFPVQSQGEATGITATEVGYLNSYASNAIGKMNREKAEMLERVARLYVRLVFTLLDPKDQINLTVDGDAEILKPDELDGSFEFSAVDGNVNPITREQKKQEVIKQAPLFLQLGVPKQKILEKIVDYWEWGSDLLTAASEAPETSQVIPAPEGAVS